MQLVGLNYEGRRSTLVKSAAIRQLTTDHSLDLGDDFTEGGKPENPEKNPLLLSTELKTRNKTIKEKK